MLSRYIKNMIVLYSMLYFNLNYTLLAKVILFLLLTYFKLKIVFRPDLVQNSFSVEQFRIKKKYIIKCNLKLDYILNNNIY